MRKVNDALKSVLTENIRIEFIANVFTIKSSMTVHSTRNEVLRIIKDLSLKQ